ncbi:penicillin acylase family protein [Rubricoccus marinus]|uniref:Penicillin acylase family protein n=1 Tax=Rubricoccus marinus TaxID=716817 RepID=A0A259TYG2_9BACT|nr:penicillin acylase family protein [Rubricoccus marinus]OZC02815.1 hypothetical protein BSZ36_07410 [Rubricoccus marinus]
MKLLARLAAVLLVVVALVCLGAWLAVRASLPDLDGEEPLAGLQGEVVVDRDSLGVVHIQATTRADAARALGYVHAQERRFQMDLLRRAASGELSALLGPTLLSADSVLRPHLFRERARAAYDALPNDHRAILDAYASGVNAGTDALGARPFEYLVLRQSPDAWRPEDALLAAYAMTIDLQRSDLDDELAVFARTEVLPPALARFLDPGGDQWDAPLAGEAVSPPPPPEADSLGGFLPSPVGDSGIEDSFLSELQRDALRVGSNNWAVSGARTASGAAMVANDMHLGISLPNIWFRASMTVTPEAGAAMTVSGVTLPGTPLVIVGSNGSVAWGFTNSYGDYVDLVRLEMEPGMTNLVRTDTGTVELSTQRETLYVAGADSVLLDVEISPWGPVLLEDGRGDRYAVQWAAHRPEATNLRLIELEGAQSLDEALDIANRSGIPAQNFVAGDRSGRIGWTIAGRIPERVGRSGQEPTASTDPDALWTGLLAPEAVPRIVDPADGQLWTANARVVSGDALRLIGDGGYASGARAQQIRDGLRALTRPIVPADLLAIQLDDRAVFMSRWRDLLSGIVTDASDGVDRSALRQRLDGWTGRASTDSPSYGVVKRFRAEVGSRIAASLMALPLAMYDDPGALSEAAIWQLASERPAHLLPPDWDSWEALLLSAADEAAAATPQTWGLENKAEIEHPLADALPLVGRLLRMPADPIPGDAWTPRVAAASFGSSERMVVSPGREDEGILHMPGGQAGHPLSPYWGAGHDAWVEGRPLPFLPGRPVWTLRLVPA